MTTILSVYLTLGAAVSALQVCVKKSEEKYPNDLDVSKDKIETPILVRIDAWDRHALTILIDRKRLLNQIE